MMMIPMAPKHVPRSEAELVPALRSLVLQLCMVCWRRDHCLDLRVGPGCGRLLARRGELCWLDLRCCGGETCLVLKMIDWMKSVVVAGYVGVWIA